MTMSVALAALSLVPPRKEATRAPHRFVSLATVASARARSREPATTVWPTLARRAARPFPAGPVAPRTPISTCESMARRAIFLPRLAYADPVPDVERPTSPWSLRITAIVLFVLLGWLLFGSSISILRGAIALLGYVVVGFVAYQLGKFVGRHGKTNN
jgi:hypothetical protein